MKNILFIIIPITLFGVSCGSIKSEKLSTVADEPASEEVIFSEAEPLNLQNELDAFVLDGHVILDFQKGDINNDQREDVILIQKAINETETSDVIDNPTPRPLMLLLREPNGGLKLAARNDQAVLCVDCGGVMGDPYQGITIKGNYFSIEHYGGSSWRWTKVVTFKFDPSKQEWFLHKDGGQSFHASEPDSTMEEKVETTKDFGVVKFTDYIIYEK